MLPLQCATGRRRVNRSGGRQRLAGPGSPAQNPAANRSRHMQGLFLDADEEMPAVFAHVVRPDDPPVRVNRQPPHA